MKSSDSIIGWCRSVDASSVTFDAKNIIYQLLEERDAALEKLKAAEHRVSAYREVAELNEYVIKQIQFNFAKEPFIEETLRLACFKQVYEKVQRIIEERKGKGEV